MNESKIHSTFLSILKEALPYALPEKTLFRYVNNEVRPALKQKQFDDHVLYLKKHDFIVALPGQLGDLQPRWRITEAGLGEIA